MLDFGFYNMDCLEGMKLLDDKSVDMIFTDLPYGTTQCSWDTVIPFDSLWEQYCRVIKDNGAILLFGAEPFSSYLRLSNISMYKYDWIWHKSHPRGHLNAKKQPMRAQITKTSTTQNGHSFPLLKIHSLPPCATST
jgi:DNA modification methylase